MKPKGAILFSMGSLIKTTQIPLEIQEVFVKSFANFNDYMFIWKHDNPEVIQQTIKEIEADNIRLVDWVDQQRILNKCNIVITTAVILDDYRLKLFISHMGMNSYLETSFAGKPTLSLPVFVDQNYNSLAAEQNNVTVKVEKHEISEEKITEALRDLLVNEK